MKVIYLKRLSLDVSGQEVPTKDRVTVRINISADYRVVDPVKVVTAVKDFTEAFTARCSRRSVRRSAP